MENASVMRYILGVVYESIFRLLYVGIANETSTVLETSNDPNSNDEVRYESVQVPLGLAVSRIVTVLGVLSSPTVNIEESLEPNLKALL